MKFLLALNWKRIVPFVTGLVAAFETTEGGKPSWGTVAGAVLSAAVVSTERLVAKRKKGAPTFDTKAAEEKVGKL